MEMNDVQRRRMDVWNYARLHTPEVGGKKRYNTTPVKVLNLKFCRRGRAVVYHWTSYKIDPSDFCLCGSLV